MSRGQDVAHWPAKNFVSSHLDVIVVGLGAMGASTCFSLAQQGVKVLGLEQFSLAHGLGSSHGRVRMIRQAYFEHADYVPLLKEAYSRWDALCELTGKKLFHRTGLLMMAPVNGGKALEPSLKSAAIHGVPIEKLDGAAITRRFPQFSNTGDLRGAYEPGGGYLQVEEVITAYCERAKMHGAYLKFEEKLTSWKAASGFIEIQTNKASYKASKIIFTAGPWASQVLTTLGLPLSVQRAAQFWFRGRGEGSAQKKTAMLSGMPCFAFDMPYGFVYGFPDRGFGVKIAAHHAPDKVDDPYHIDRNVNAGDLTLVHKSMTTFLPALDLNPVYSSV